MKTVALTCVGKMKEKYYAEAIAEYTKRLSKFCKLDVRELPDSPHEDAVRRESEAVLGTLGKGEYRILCDIGGELVTSEQLSQIMDKAYGSGCDTVRFIIGGSCGVDDGVRAAADKRISFGRVTYPHRLMRVILLEQIYRAFTISAGTPYHK